MDEQADTVQFNTTNMDDNNMINSSYYHFSEVAFTPEEVAEIQKKLETKLPKELVSFRQGPSGRIKCYIS